MKKWHEVGDLAAGLFKFFERGLAYPESAQGINKKTDLYALPGLFLDFMSGLAAIFSCRNATIIYALCQHLLLTLGST